MRGVEGWGPIPYQWATTGYQGAIGTGRTICGFLFGGAIFLGYLSGKNATQAPEVKDEARKQAMSWVNDLFKGFIERFSTTDCQTLTGCDWSKEEDRNRYYKEEIYKDQCFRFCEYVLSNCLDRTASNEKL